MIGWCTAATLDKCPNIRIEFTGRVIQIYAGQLPGPPPPSDFDTGCSEDWFAETVGGLPANLDHSHCSSHHVTQAGWPALALLFVGETDDALTAQLELQIYRTVRFTGTLGH